MLHEEFAAVGKYGTGFVYDRIKEKIIKLGGIFKFNIVILKVKIKTFVLYNVIQTILVQLKRLFHTLI